MQKFLLGWLLDLAVLGAPATPAASGSALYAALEERLSDEVRII